MADGIGEPICNWNTSLKHFQEESEEETNKTSQKRKTVKCVHNHPLHKKTLEEAAFGR
jgi:hypothetical protein